MMSWHAVAWWRCLLCGSLASCAATIALKAVLYLNNQICSRRGSQSRHVLALLRIMEKLRKPLSLKTHKGRHKPEVERVFELEESQRTTKERYLNSWKLKRWNSVYLRRSQHCFKQPYFLFLSLQCVLIARLVWYCMLYVMITSMSMLEARHHRLGEMKWTTFKLAFSELQCLHLPTTGCCFWNST